MPLGIAIVYTLDKGCLQRNKVLPGLTGTTAALPWCADMAWILSVQLG